MFARANARSLFPLLLAWLLAPVGSAQAATLDQDLRFTPSTSIGVVGYVVHVGSSPGFFAGTSDYSVDIGSSYQLAGGVGFYPLAGVISDSAYLVMQAYDAQGLHSAPSNELYVQITPPVDPNACSTDADCGDGDACNGTERCVANACVSGPAPVCGDPDPCRVGTCDAVTGCGSIPAPDGTTCDDGHAGTVDDACRVGTCVGVQLPPPPPDPDPDPGPVQKPGGSSTTPASVLMAEDFDQATFWVPEEPWSLIDTVGDRRSWTWMYEVIGSNEGGSLLYQRMDVEDEYHLEYDAPDGEAWQSYEYAGRMRIEQRDALIGATFVSRRIEGGGFMALIRDAGSPSFHVVVESADPGLVCRGNPDTGFVPEVSRWSIFRLRAIAEVDGLHVQARVWDEDAVEPTDWPVDCVVDGFAMKRGRVGVTARGPGEKFFDDLIVWSIGGSDAGSETTLPLHREDFETFGRGQHPDEWVDAIGPNRVRSGNPLVWVDPAPGGGQALTMQSVGSDMSSTFDAAGSDRWSDYEVTGRMTASHPRSKFGLLIYSQRHVGGAAIGLLRGQNSDTFRITPVGGSSGACTGTTDTGVRPIVDAWQRFRVRATGEDASIRVRARVWSDGEAEPTDWQADCVTAPGLVPADGTFGVWSSGTSAKYWDDFEVREVGGD